MSDSIERDSVEMETRSSLICYVQRLPDELLLLVLEYLNVRDTVSVSLVCHRWYQLASYRAVAVRRIRDEKRVHPQLRQLLIVLRSVLFPKILERARYLHTLVIHKRVPLENDMFKALEQLPHLVHLDVFTKSKTLPTEALPVAQRLHTLVINESVPHNVLRDLALSSNLTQVHMYGRSLNYDPRMMTALIASRRAHLTELTLRCNELPAQAYKEIANCPNLVVLRLYTCWLLRAPCAVNITCLPKLRVLHITGARMLWTSQLRFIIEVFPETLEEFCFSGNCFSEEHIEPLVEKGQNLLVLELWNTPISNDGLCRMAMQLPLLREFDINKVFRCEQVDELSRHPTLVKLRCRRHCFKDLLWDLEFDKTGVSKEPIATACTRYARGCLRIDGSGFRSGLYYHWSVDHHPRPLPCCWNNYGRMHSFDDSEDDWSLLGPDVRPSKLRKKMCFRDAGFESIGLQSLCRTCIAGSPRIQQRREMKKRYKEEYKKAN